MSVRVHVEVCEVVSCVLFSSLLKPLVLFVLKLTHIHTRYTQNHINFFSCIFVFFLFLSFSFHVRSNACSCSSVSSRTQQILTHLLTYMHIYVYTVFYPASSFPYARLDYCYFSLINNKNKTKNMSVIKMTLWWSNVLWSRFLFLLFL